MKTFLAGLVLGVIAVPLALYGLVVTGKVPVATSGRPMPLERRIAGMALRAKLLKEMPQNVPIVANEAAFVAGATIYREHCAFCHGLPNQKPSAAASGMFPKPPQLFRGIGVTDDPPQETFWKVKNGIRLSGMPGYAKSLSENEMWQVSVLLANADKLPASAREALQPAPAAPGAHHPAH